MGNLTPSAPHPLYHPVMELMMLCWGITVLQVAAMGAQSPTFYAVLRLIMPVLAALVAYGSFQNSQPFEWIAPVIVSGLIFFGFGELPRFVWRPINLSVAGLYLAYSGHLVWQTVA